MCKSVDQFLMQSGMHVATINMDAAVRSYRDEMCRGLAGEPSSLAMIPTYIHPLQGLPCGHEVLMIDAGGTNLRLAVACYQEDAGAINCESGTYSGFVQGQYDKALDSFSLHPGRYRLEKMLSGVYEGNLIYRIAVGAAEQGLFSQSFARGIAQHSTFTMHQIDSFYQDPTAEGLLNTLTADSASDRRNLLRIIEISQQRAACVTAITFAATMLEAGCGKDKAHPTCITGEGSGFKKSKLFRQKLQQYCDDYLRGKLGLHFEVVDGENTTFIGAAVAALMEV